MPSLLGCYFVLVSPKTCHPYVLGQQTPAMLWVCCFASIQVGGLPDRMKMEVIEPLRPNDFFEFCCKFNEGGSRMSFFCEILFFFRMLEMVKG